MNGKANYLAYLFIIYSLCTTSSNLMAQTCCTGSAPITGSIRISSIPVQQWNFSLIADHNYLSDLFAYDKKLNNDNLIRTTNTFLWQTNYGFTRRLSAGIIIPYIYKSAPSSNNNTLEQTSARGLGDISLTLQYAFIQRKSFSLLLGSGIKLATGATQAKDSDTQLILEPSLQPGSGSFDFLLYAQFQYSMAFRPSLSIIQSLKAEIGHSWSHQERLFIM